MSQKNSKPISFNPSLKEEEYLSLIKTLVDQQYGTKEEEKVPGSEVLYQDQLNLTDATSDEILEKLHMTGNITVGNFYIKIRNYEAVKNAVSLNISILEDKVFTFKGNKYKTISKINMLTDSRFKNEDWAKPVNNYQKLPIETIRQIISHLQFVYKYPQFL
jgi:hypothetical protein